MPLSFGQLESMLAQWESDPSLMDRANFSRRSAIQDDLDRYFNETDTVVLDSRRDLVNRALALSTQLNSINSKFFNSIRNQIQTGTCPTEFIAILRKTSFPAPHGIAYDHLDDLISGILQLEPVSEEPCLLDPDSVFYQPTPARHIFHLITAASITSADTLIDLGSGLGHVPLLVSICTGASASGIDLDPAYITSATNCARTLNLRSVNFLAEDARDADLSTGTIFYLYTPFSGPTLGAVLEALREQAIIRPIRICTFGPCTFTVSEQPWLEARSQPTADQITVFIPCC